MIWNIVRPHLHKVRLPDLEGELVAVDLQSWAIKDVPVGRRNTFFRTSALLKYNILPIFILGNLKSEGKSGIEKVQKVHLDFMGGKECKQTNRSVFEVERYENCVAHYEKTVEMLRLIGLRCEESSGDGSALLAKLDCVGAVNGVISDNSDVILYGARKIYKKIDFNGSGSVDVLEMSDIERNININREKLIAAKLLTKKGSGANGFGAVRWFQYLSIFDGDIIQRLKHLKTDKVLAKFEVEKQMPVCQKSERKVPNKVHSSCRHEHVGFAQDTSPSYASLSAREKKLVDFEIILRNKVLRNPDFPEGEKIKKYLNNSTLLRNKEIYWNEPDIEKFLSHMKENLNWCECYAFKKILPLYCRWALLNSNFKLFVPVRILKKTTYQRLPVCVLLWKVQKRFNFQCENSLNLDCKSLEIEGYFTTLEKEDLLREKCSEICESYDSQVRRIVEAKKKQKGSKKVDFTEEITDARIQDLMRGLVNFPSAVTGQIQWQGTSNQSRK